MMSIINICEVNFIEKEIYEVGLALTGGASAGILGDKAIVNKQS